MNTADTTTKSSLDWEWVAVYGGGSTCPDGQKHTPHIENSLLGGVGVSCWRCDALLKMVGPKSPTGSDKKRGLDV